MQIVCFSGGHSSALVAIEAVKKYGKNNVVLLNHNLSSVVEHKDIKRFKNDVSNYLDIPITYSNMNCFEENTPLQVCLKSNAFSLGTGNAICTSRLKTEPFYKWLSDNYSATLNFPNKDITILYGFDKNETARINRRVGVMANKGYKTDYPLALWERTIDNIQDVGIELPVTYKIFKHANCIGCLKAGIQHWYIVYCLYPYIFEQALFAEKHIGYSIIKNYYLEDLIPRYDEMKSKGICPNDKENSSLFWSKVNKAFPVDYSLPCECAL